MIEIQSFFTYKTLIFYKKKHFLAIRIFEGIYSISHSA